MSRPSRIKLANSIAKSNNQWLYDLGGAITLASGLYGGAKALSETLGTDKNPHRYFYTPGITGHVASNSFRGGLAGLAASILAGTAFTMKGPVAGLGTLAAGLPLAMWIASSDSPGYSKPTMGEYKSDPDNLNELKTYLVNKKPESFTVTPDEYFSEEQDALKPGQYISNGDDL